VAVHRKLVSVLLVALIPTASSLALAACPQGLANMGNPRAEMAMMDMAPVQISFTTAQTNLCCQMSPAEIASGPVRASVGKDTNLVFAATAPVAVTMSSPKPKTLSEHSPRSSSPPQPFLCVFLI